ncbi:MAG TPA: hypothetical protein VGM20_08295 [Gemmatimonadales bacterium]|jgi:ABC-type branched-subunit amino acid transport system permease subunit
MFRGAARFVLRVAGWLLTPLILLVAAAVGALGGLVVTRRMASTTSLEVTFALAFIVAGIVLRLWMRLLRNRPELRHTLSMTTEGIPETELVERLVNPPEPPQSNAR